MTNMRFNQKKLVAVLLTGFILITSVSCTKEKTNLKGGYQQQSGYTETIEQNKESSVLNDNNNDNKKIDLKESTSDDTGEKTVENSINESYTSTDIEVLDYFNNIEKSVETELEKETNETTKDKLKGTFITIVDFIFYDSEINGIKFDDLTAEAKQNILKTVSSIDNKIMKKYPTYKEDISTTTSKAYNKASELIKTGANNIKNFSKEKLGEENYNSIIESKDELVYYTKKAVNIIGDIAGSIWENGKSKIKTWYENFKN